jgi:hypothetical protein
VQLDHVAIGLPRLADAQAAAPPDGGGPEPLGSVELTARGAPDGEREPLDGSIAFLSAADLVDLMDVVSLLYA